MVSEGTVTATEAEATVTTEETAPFTGAETATPESAETEQSAATAETGTASEPPDWRTALEGIEDGDLEEHPQIKSLLSRREHGAEQRAQETATRAMAQRERTWKDQKGYQQDLHDVLSQGSSLDDSGQLAVQVDGEKVDGIVGRIWDDNVRATVNSVGALLDQRVGEGFTPSGADMQKLKTAFSAFLENPDANGVGLLELELDIYDQSVIQKGTPELEQSLRKKWEQELADKAEAANAESAQQQNSEAGSPTQVGGSSAPSVTISSMVDADKLYNEGALSHERYKEERKRFGVPDRT